MLKLIHNLPSNLMEFDRYRYVLLKCDNQSNIVYLCHFKFRINQILAWKGNFTCFSSKNFRVWNLKNVDTMKTKFSRTCHALFLFLLTYIQLLESTSLTKRSSTTPLGIDLIINPSWIHFCAFNAGKASLKC